MRIAVFSLSLLISSFAVAQTENAAFSITGKGVASPFATDYQALGINPSNLDFDSEFEKPVTFGFGEFGISAYSEALAKGELRDNILQSNLSEMTPEERRELAGDIAGTAIALDLDVMTTGIHVKTNNAGGFAFTTRDRFDYYSVYGPQVTDLGVNGFESSYFDLLVLSTGDTIPNTSDLPEDSLELVESGLTLLQNAQNLSSILDGTQLSMSWMREYHIGWGKKVLSTEEWAIYGGIGLKYIQGVSFLQIDAADGKATALGASPAGLEALFRDESEEISGDGFKPVGNGFGVDLGATFQFQNDIRIGVSIVDIGSVTWNNGSYQLKDTLFTEFDQTPIDEPNVGGLVNNVSEFIEWNGDVEHTTKLPTTIRVGVGWMINEKIRVGGEWVAPANDELSSLDQGVLAVGGDLTPTKWLQLSAGFIDGGNYDFKIPAGVTFRVGGGAWEFGAASRDIITFFSEEQPTISGAFGFLRFRV